MSDTKEREVVVIGAGPAGLAASIYLGRDKRNPLVLEKLMAGGLAVNTEIENYPGFPEPIHGSELMMRFEEQAKRFGAEVETAEVTSLRKTEEGVLLETSGGRIRAGAVLLATGSVPRTLGLPGEKEYRGRGVSYCGTCDGAFFRDVEVAAIGGGNTAIEEALFLTRFASKVHVIHRRDSLRAERVLQEKAFANSKIEFHWNRLPVEIKGGDKGVEALVMKDKETGELETLPVRAVFIFAGYVPATSWLEGSGVELDGKGAIKTDDKCRTSLDGVFAAGDVVSGAPRQIATAAGEGVKAALSIKHYLDGM